MPSVKSEPIHLNFEGMCTSCVYFSKLYLISEQMSLIRLKLSFKGKLEATHLGVKREETKTFCGWTKTTKIRTKTTKNYPKLIIHDSIIKYFWNHIDKINNIPRYNLINTKYRQMAFRSTRWRCSRVLFGNPWSNESEWWPPEGDNPRIFLFSSQIKN